MRRSDKGFILVDSLMVVFIVSCICLLCFSVYRSIEKYHEGYDRYRSLSDQHLEEIYARMRECEPCETDESD